MGKTSPALLILLISLPLLAQGDLSEEQQAVKVLQSDAALSEKEAACLRLKRTGTAKAIPALASLLREEHLAQWALDALETMPCAEAGEALCAALRSTSGKTKAGVAHALGVRRERRALPDLAVLLADPDAAVASSAAWALGRIGGAESARALTRAKETAPPSVHGALVDALLECADRFLADGDVTRASAVYAEIYASGGPSQVRTAAYRGLVLSSSDQAVALVCDALKGGDPAAQIAAVPMVRELQRKDATKEFAAALGETTPVIQAALIDALAQRGDIAAAPQVALAARSAEPTVRGAAIKALAELGDASHVPLLAERLTAPTDAEREAARRTLDKLRRGDVCQALLAQIERSNPEVRVELVGVLMRRGERRAVPNLLRMTETGDNRVGVAAVQALGKLADGTQGEALLGIILSAKSNEMREAARSALVAVAARSERLEILVERTLKAMQGADTPMRCFLLRTAGQMGGPKALAALQAGANDPNPEICDAAVRALADCSGVEALPALLTLAREGGSMPHRILALRGYWRLVGLMEKQPLDVRLKLCQDGLAAAQRPEEKKQGLGQLGRIPAPEALQAALPHLEDPDLVNEAAAAALDIAEKLADPHPKAADEAASAVLAHCKDGAIVHRALALRGKPKGGGPFIRDWLVCGPYSREGITGAERVFNIPFGPEKPGESVQWRPVPPGDRANLGAIFPGKENCAAYLKTEIIAPQDCNAQLLLGSDDGVKAWLNGAVVHSDNTDRNIVPDQDMAPIHLKKGPNLLMLKVTQGSGGWMACARVVRMDGTPMTDQRAQAQGAGALPIAPPAPQPLPPSRPCALPKRDAFQKLRLSDQFYAEGACYGDFNRDGKMDAVAGPFWFEGPDFRKRHEIWPPKSFSPSGYSDSFFTFTADFNGDGWMDVLCLGFPGKEACWYENPAGKTGPWKRHPACSEVGNESPTWGDIGGDGQPELVFNNVGYMGYATFDKTKPDQPWTFHAVTPQDKRYHKFTHGIGFGDINGDKRTDLVEAVGWWEQPADVKADQPWIFHPYHFADAAAQMLVTDVDGDGLADIITSWHCHRYGLLWYKQIKGPQGRTDWQKNVILSPTPDLHSADLRVSQLHALALVDMNGDGLPDVLTGKRFWAHGPKGDVEPDAPAVVCWFELKRGGGQTTFVPHLVDDDSGVGTQVAATDLNGDGLPDVITANKKGIFLHLSQRASPQ